MIFNDSKYTRWYNQIIEQAKVRILSRDVYTEKHHVIPQSLGGNNRIDNLVVLTAREHFICHWLLTKMVTGVAQKKMAYACKRMMHSKNSSQPRYQITSRIYENLKIQLNVMLKNRQFSESWKEKLKQAARKRADNESIDAKEIRRKTMISANKSRKGEKRLATTGDKNHMFGIRLTGESNHFFGKKHTEETLAKLKVPKLKLQCQHCKKVVGGQGNLVRWHNNNCKLLLGESKFHA
jgi:hypothetical protein